jgi:hypothetical protein
MLALKIVVDLTACVRGGERGRRILFFFKDHFSRTG